MEPRNYNVPLGLEKIMYDNSIQNKIREEGSDIDNDFVQSINTKISKNESDIYQTSIQPIYYIDRKIIENINNINITQNLFFIIKNKLNQDFIDDIFKYGINTENKLLKNKTNSLSLENNKVN